MQPCILETYESHYHLSLEPEEPAGPTSPKRSRIGKKLIETFDVNGDGKIDFGDVKQGIVNMGQKLTRKFSSGSKASGGKQAQAPTQVQALADGAEEGSADGAAAGTGGEVEAQHDNDDENYVDVKGGDTSNRLGGGGGGGLVGKVKRARSSIDDSEEEKERSDDEGEGRSASPGEERGQEGKKGSYVPMWEQVEVDVTVGADLGAEEGEEEGTERKGEDPQEGKEAKLDQYGDNLERPD